MSVEANHAQEPSQSIGTGWGRKVEQSRSILSVHCNSRGTIDESQVVDLSFHECCLGHLYLGSRLFDSGEELVNQLDHVDATLVFGL